MRTEGATCSQTAVLRQLTRPLWGPLLVALCGCAAAPPGDAATVPVAGGRPSALVEILPGASAVIPSLGTGWSTIAEDYMGRCIFGGVRKLHGFDASGTLKVTSNLGADKAQQQMGFGLGSRAHFAIGSGALKAQAASAMTRDAFSSVWVFSANYLAEAEELDFEHDTRLTVIGQSAARHGWQQACGDEFVYQVQKGAQLFLVYRLDFQSEALKKTVEGDLGGQYTLLEVNGSLKKLKNLLERHAQLTIEVYQFGGDPRKITGIITGPAASLKQTEQAAKAVIRCGVDDLDACEEFLTHALVYATSLHEPEAFPMQIGTAPSPVMYVTMPWSRLGKEAHRSPESYEVAEARLGLSLLFDRVHAAKKRVELLLGSAWSDAAQRDELQPWSLRLTHNLGQIGNAVGLCYDDLSLEGRSGEFFSAATVARCRDAVAHLEKQLQLPPPSSLRGAEERAIARRYSELRGVRRAAEADDPAGHTVAVGEATCAPFDDGAAICAYDTTAHRHARARALFVPPRIYAAWSALSPEQQNLAARHPLSEGGTTAGLPAVDFAPHGALVDPGNAPPRLLYDHLLDYVQSLGTLEALGMPLSHQARAPDGRGDVLPFANATVYCRDDGGRCHELPAQAYAAWQAAGGHASCLGYPKEQRDEGWLTCFEGGALVYDEETHKSHVQCPGRWGRCR